MDPTHYMIPIGRFDQLGAALARIEADAVDRPDDPLALATLARDARAAWYAMWIEAETAAKLDEAMALAMVGGPPPKPVVTPDPGRPA